jgi:hypothetical protein
LPNLVARQATNSNNLNFVSVMSGLLAIPTKQRSNVESSRCK